jgi:hypothetical protein
LLSTDSSSFRPSLPLFLCRCWKVVCWPTSLSAPRLSELHRKRIRGWRFQMSDLSLSLSLLFFSFLSSLDSLIFLFRLLVVCFPFPLFPSLTLCCFVFDSQSIDQRTTKPVWKCWKPRMAASKLSG